MITQNPAVITEAEKGLLTNHLIDQVINGLSGRDQEDLVDVQPSRTLFAGVLQPTRAIEIEASQPGPVNNDTMAGTAIGLDFRVAPTINQETIRLRITPRWSHYYTVFPTWEQVTRATEARLDYAKNPSSSFSSLASEKLLVHEVETMVTNEDLVDTVDGIDTFDASEHQGIVTDTGSVVLPRVFRRYDILPGTFVVDVPSKLPTTDFIAQEEIAAAIEQAQSSMKADPYFWRHLGSPEKHERILGDVCLLERAETYLNALRALKGEPVLLPSWSVALQAETGPDPAIPEAIRVRVLLVNTTPERDESVRDKGLQERFLFDAGLIIEIEGGKLLPFDFLLAPKDYRNKPQMAAKGINCTVMQNSLVRNRLETETLPIFKQPLYRTKDALEIPFEILDTPHFIQVLEDLAKQMDAYLQQWDAFLTSEAPTQFKPEEVDACKHDRNEFSSEINRYRLGIEVLRRDKKLAEAFQLMNRVFSKLSNASGGRVQAWRLFQIGFILSQMPSLAVRELPHDLNDEYALALRAGLDEVGILWFPTGGGKTEAYLGLIATALLYDRLRGKTRGVCAWMRFPLRMLSLQQLERLTKVIATLNEIRAGDPRLCIGDPFAIGYYVGDRVTPNSLSEDDMRRYEQSKDLREEVRQLRKCPFCGTGVEIRPQRNLWRLSHVCLNSACFSNTSESLGAYKGSLPVCIVDNEIYRYLPSVLVGTVDKLAIIGRERKFAHLVRGVMQQCQIHGYASYDECTEHWNGCKAKKRDLLKLDRVKDPGPSLLIQDELHLLRAELGVFNGHYEGLLKYLGAKAYLPPKILAATATIEAYDTHAFHIYLSRAKRYPQPSWEQGESFYATSKPVQYRRNYVGILCHSRAIEDPALQVLSLYQREIRRLKADPQHAASIMQRPDATQEVILDTLRLYDLSLGYVNRKATGGSLIDKLSKINKMLSVENLGGVQARLLTGDQPIEEVGEVLDRIEHERKETEDQRLDIVFATNLISHGVDLERINMMVMCGMPSHYAEYVQATSRAARSHPGAVFVCFKSRDPREHSQYEFFPSMHEHMERLIEAVAVNRFASFAPQKTIPGLLAGILLCDLTPDLYGSYIPKPLDHLSTLQAALGINLLSSPGTQANCIEESTLLVALEKIIGVDTKLNLASPAQVAYIRKKIKDVLQEQIEIIGRSHEKQLKDAITPITSFRDVDEGIEFGSIDSASLVMKLRAR
jgi:hypothetical protein